MKRKAQIQQVFVYIVAVVILGVIVFFGYTSINKFIKEQEKVAFIEFKSRLENSISRMAPKYNSVNCFDSQDRFSVPGDYKEVCFMDLDKNPGDSLVCNQNSDEFRPGMCSEWEGDWQNSPGWQREDVNVFLDPPGMFPISAFKLEIDGGKDYLCLPVINGRIDFKLTGKGEKTMVSAVENCG